MTSALLSVVLVFQPVAPVSTPGSEGASAAVVLLAPAVLAPQPEEALWLTADALTADLRPQTLSFDWLTLPVPELMGLSAATVESVVSDSPASTPPTLREPAPPTLTDAQLFRLRMCESTDNYGAHLVWGTQWESRATGAYQFEQPTWDGVAARHMPWLVGVRPHHAWPAEQDAMARWLWSERGRYPWPVCGLRVGAP